MTRMRRFLGRGLCRLGLHAWTFESTHRHAYRSCGRCGLGQRSLTHEGPHWQPTMGRGGVDPRDCSFLREWGFRLAKDGNTIQVSYRDILDVTPAPGGFRVTHRVPYPHAATVCTTQDIEYPPAPGLLDEEWIFVHYDRLDHEPWTSS